MFDACEDNYILGCGVCPAKVFCSSVSIAIFMTLILNFSYALLYNAKAASFNCNRATTHVERLICSSETLSRMDDQLAAEFLKAKRTSLDGHLLNKEERNWLKERNDCVTETCLVQEYSLRLGQLNGSTVSSTPANNVSEPTLVKKDFDSQTSGPDSTGRNIELKNAQSEVEEANQHASKICGELHFTAEHLVASGTLTAGDEPISSAKDQAVQSARIAEESCRKKFQEAKEKSEAEKRQEIADQKAQSEADAQLVAAASVEGQKYAEQYGIKWVLSTKRDEMTDGQTLASSSDQTSEDSAVQAQVTLTCNTATKNFELRAMFFDEKGKGIDLLETSQSSNGPAVVHVKTRSGSDAEISDQFLPIGDFRNEIRLTGSPIKQAMQGQLSLLGNIYGQSFASALSRQFPGGLSEADTLLRRSRLLFQVKTAAGEVVVKVLPYDQNVLPVVKACVSSHDTLP